MNENMQSNLLAICRFAMRIGTLIIALAYMELAAYPLECFGQRVALVPKYSSWYVHPNTSSYPRIFSQGDSQANWIQTDNLDVGMIQDSAPAAGPFDTAFITFRTPDAVRVQILWCGWDRGIQFSLCDTVGPLDWQERAFALHYVTNQGDERLLRFIALWIPPGMSDGTQNPEDRPVYWGRMEMSKIAANVGSEYTNFDLMKSHPVRWYDELGREVDSTSRMARFRR